MQELLFLGYPKSWLAIEVPLRSLCPSTAPYLSKLPNRRIDLVVYAKEDSSSELTPLLLIECKAGVWTAQGWRQLLGYQHYLKAPFVALITPDSCYMHAADTPQETPLLLQKLPSLPQLLAKRKKK